MKKTTAFVCLVVFALACTAPPTNSNLASDASRNANVAPTTAPITEADAIAKEKAIWEAIRVRDFEAFGSMLDSDQIEVLDVGVFDKAGSIAGVKTFEPTEVVFSDWKHLPIDKDAFIVTYTANMKGKYEGKEFKPQTVRGSSAWVNRAGKWLAIYHQECPLKPPMTPSPTPGSATKATASPTAAPIAAATPGADPIANEKMVWDLFKSKNYDVFAELLAADFMEIEPEGVYDKAGSVQGVRTFDASKAVLSDFRTVNIDANAAVVTYVVNNPGFSPGGDRHSTIWVNRGGKWQGLFHHGGTPVVKMPATPRPSASPTVK